MKKRFRFQMLFYVAVYFLPEFLCGLFMMGAKHGLAEKSVYLLRCVSYLAAALFLILLFSDFSGEKPGQDQKEDWLTILKKGVKLIPAALLFSMTYAVSDLLFRDLTLNNLFAAVMMAGRLQLYVWLIFLIQALVQAALLVWLIGSSRKKRNAKLFVWMLIVFPVNLGIVLLNGYRGSILAGIPFLGSTFLGRLAAYMLQAVISALLLECIFRILDKTMGKGADDQAGKDEPAVSGKAGKTELIGRIAYIGVTILAILVIPFGMIHIGKLNPMIGLTDEVLNYVNASILTLKQGNVEDGLRIADYARGDVYLWQALTTKKDDDGKQEELIADALKLGGNNEYQQLLYACERKDALEAVERMVLIDNVSSTDCDMVLLRLYAEKGAKDSRKAIRNEILLRQLNAGNYIDNFVTVKDAQKKLDKKAIKENLETLKESVPYARSAELYEQARQHDGGTLEDCYHFLEESGELTDLYASFVKSYFLDRAVQLIDENDDDGDRTDEYLKLADTFPEDFSVQMLAAMKLAQVLEDPHKMYYNTLVDYREKAVNVIGRFWELYQKEYKNYQEMSEEEQGSAEAWANLFMQESGLGISIGTGFKEEDFKAFRSLTASMYLAVGDTEDAFPLMEGTVEYILYKGVEALNAEEYEKIPEIVKSRLDEEPTQLQKGQLAYLQAVAYLWTGDYTESIRYASSLADGIRDTTGYEKTVLDNLMMAYASMMTFPEPYYIDRNNPARAYYGIVQANFNVNRNMTEEEQAMIDQNEYLQAYIRGMDARHYRSEDYSIREAWRNQKQTEEMEEYYNTRIGYVDELLKKDEAMAGLWYIKACTCTELTTGGQIGYKHLIYDWEEILLNEAEGYLKKAIEYDFTNANYHFLLGCIYDQIGDYIQAYREACYADEYFVADGQPSGLNVNFLNQNEIDHLKKGLEEFFKTDGEYHDIRTKEE